MEKEHLKKVSLRFGIFVIATMVISVIAVFVLNKRTEQLEQELAMEMEADIIIPSFFDEIQEGGETDPENNSTAIDESKGEVTETSDETLTDDTTSEAVSYESSLGDETDVETEKDTDEDVETASESDMETDIEDVTDDEIEATTEAETAVPSQEQNSTEAEVRETTTAVPTTVAPTTQAPTTVAPTTVAPTTQEVHVHRFSAADCYNAEKCSCGATGNPALGHDFGSNNEKCSRCGAANPNYVKPVEPAHLISGVSESRTNITDAQMSVFKNRVIQGLNNLRSEKGLGALGMNDFLNSGSVLRSLEIPSAWSHTRPNGDRGIYVLENCGGWYAEAINALRTGQGYNCAFGENLAVVYSYSDYGGTDQELLDLADEMVANWRASETHYTNIIYPGFNNIGIGVNVTLVEENGATYHAFWTCTLFSN